MDRWLIFCADEATRLGQRQVCVQDGKSLGHCSGAQGAGFVDLCISANVRQHRVLEIDSAIWYTISSRQIDRHSCKRAGQLAARPYTRLLCQPASDIARAWSWPARKRVLEREQASNSVSRLTTRRIPCWMSLPMHAAFILPLERLCPARELTAWLKPL
jgi:hypothetical protein